MGKVSSPTVNHQLQHHAYLQVDDEAVMQALQDIIASLS